jgi:hypothetical protein
MTAQLKKDGTLGKPETFGFVPAKVIADHLKVTGNNMSLTVGLSFRNPTTHNKPFDNIAAIRWLRDNERSYTYEACYVEGDDSLHVTALSGNDLF